MLRVYSIFLGLLFLSACVLWRALEPNRRSFLCGLIGNFRSIGTVEVLDSRSMALRYTAQQLLNLKQNYHLQKDAYELCRNAGLLRQRRYLNRSVGRSYCFSTSNNICVPTSRRQTKRASYTGAVLGNLSSLVRSELPSVVRQSPVNVALFNARSVNNKALLLSDIITDRKLDLLFLTESWHKQNDGLLFNQITPEGYGLFDLPRLTGRGGGIIVVHNLQFNISAVRVPQFTSFECLVLSISAPKAITIATVYRPPKPNEAFMSEFADLLSMLCFKFKNILILGDFNIHIDQNDCMLTKDFLFLLDCFNLKQFISGPTHNKGHTLDLVIANDAIVSQLSSVDIGLSDHFAIFFNLEISLSCTTSSHTVNFRKWKSINSSDFADTVVSSLSGLQLASLEDKILQLNTLLASNLDSFAPLKSRCVSFARSAPWYNDELRSKKVACRKLERKWRDSGLNVFYQAWKDHLGEYRTEIESARSVYFSQIIDNNQSNPRHLFHTINRLLKVNDGISLPVSNKLCNDFLNFFSSKIDNVYKLIQVAPISSSTVCPSCFHGTLFTTFFPN